MIKQRALPMNMAFREFAMDAAALGGHAVDAEAPGLQSPEDLDGPALFAAACQSSAATSCTTSLSAAADGNLASLLSASYYHAAPPPSRRGGQRSAYPHAALPLYSGLDFALNPHLDEDRCRAPSIGAAADESQPNIQRPAVAQKSRRKRHHDGGAMAATKTTARKPGRPPKTAESLKGEDPEEVSSIRSGQPAPSRYWRLTRGSTHSDVADSSAWRSGRIARARSRMSPP